MDASESFDFDFDFNFNFNFKGTYLHGWRMAPSAKMWPHSPCSSFWKNAFRG